MNRNNVLILALFIVLNILLAFYQPFSKDFTVDEGQYLLVGKKILDGWVPYRDIVDNKPLGLYLSLIPAVLLCGSDIVKLRLYGAFIAGLDSFFIFLIGEKIKDRLTGLASAFTYICIVALLGGYLLITEPMANLFILALFYILISKKKTYSDFFLIGVLAAISCSIRQTCIFVFAPLAFELIYYNRERDRKKIISAALGGMLVIAVPMLLYLILNSAFWDAVYWCGYADIRFWRTGLGDKIDAFSIFSIFFYPLMLFAIVTLRDMTRERKLMWLWLLSALVMVQIGFSSVYNVHNYLLLGPPLSILAVLGASELYRLSCDKSRFTNIYRGIFIMLSAGTLLLIFYELAMIASLGRNDKNYDQQWAVSEYISSHTSKDDGIFVFMADPYIYYISDRKPVTKITFFWIELLHNTNDSEKNEYIFEPLEKGKPKYVVMNPLLYENDSVVMLVRDYLDENYTHVGDWGMYHLYERKPG